MMPFSVVLTSLVIFGYLTLVSPVLSAVFAGMNLHTLFAGPLMAVALAALIPYFFRPGGLRVNHLKAVNFLTLASPFFSLFLIAYSQRRLDETLLARIGELKPLFLEDLLIESTASFHLKIEFFVSIPFFLYGYFISSLFHNSSEDKTAGIYANEVLGTCLGITITLFLLDHVSFQTLIAFLSFISIAATFHTFQKHGRIAALLFLLPIGLSSFRPGIFEPQRNLNWSVRDFESKATVRELKRSWTSYSKVQTLSVSVPGDSYKLIAVGDGTGLARLPDRASSQIQLPDAVAVAFSPRTALVLFSGAGADLNSINRSLGNSVELTGVELNPRVIEHGLAEKDSALTALATYKNVHLVQSEARAFLETTKDSYDSILYSWSGATVAHYSGAVLHTTQYAFTTEAIEKAYSRLNPNGHIIFLGASKINLLLSFLRINEGIPNFSLKKSAVLVGPRDISRRSINTGWDNYTLVLKKGAFTETEVSKLGENVSAQGYQIEFSPFHEGSDDIRALKVLFSTPSWQEARRKISDSFGLYFDAHSDDRPFVYTVSPPAPIFSLRYWRDTFTELEKSKPMFRMRIYIFVQLALLVGILLLGGPGRGFKGAAREFSRFSFFSSIGFFSTALLILATYKSILYLGNPTAAIAFAQGLTVFAGFLGARQVSKKTPLSAQTVFAIAVAIAPVYLAWTHFADWPKYFTAPTLFVTTILPVALLSALLFTYGLKRAKLESPGKLPLYFSANTLGGGIAALFVPLAVENAGFRTTSSAVLSVLIFSVLSFLASVARGRERA